MLQHLRYTRSGLRQWQACQCCSDHPTKGSTTRQIMHAPPAKDSVPTACAVLGLHAPPGPAHADLCLHVLLLRLAN
jgi:hypothetical protein